MSPYGSVALGLGLVLVDISIDGFDLLPDVVGWLFAAGGAHALSSRHGAYAAGRSLAVANAVLAALPYIPLGSVAVGNVLDVLVALGALGFVLALCAGLVATEDSRTARTANAIRWFQVAATVATVVVLFATEATPSLGTSSDPGAWWPLAVVAIVMGIGANLRLVVLLLSLRQPDAVRASQREPA